MQFHLLVGVFFFFFSICALDATLRVAPERKTKLKELSWALTKLQTSSRTAMSVHRKLNFPQFFLASLSRWLPSGLLFASVVGLGSRLVRRALSNTYPSREFCPFCREIAGPRSPLLVQRAVGLNDASHCLLQSLRLEETCWESNC